MSCALYSHVVGPNGERRVASQLGALHEYVDKHPGWSIVGEFTDIDRRRAAPAADRPGLRELLALVETGTIVAVLVTETSVLTREPVEHYALMQHLRAAGVELVSTCRAETAFEATLRELFKGQL